MIDITRFPDYAEVLVEKDEVNDASLRYEMQNDRVNVYLSAPTSHPKIVKLRWKAKIDREVRVLGDAWERSYGDLGFIGLTTEKAHPWYFIMEHSDGTDCVGVAVRPASLISWVVDCEGVTAFCDVRSGSIGVELGDRELLIGSFMSESYSSDRDNTFEAACDFCGKMSPDPVLPTEPVYGGNNWCYAYGDTSYEDIISDASLQAKLAEGLDNSPFMVIDAGWQQKSVAGPWFPNEKYGDMKKVADEFKIIDGHYNPYYFTYYFNLKTGEELCVSDLFSDGWEEHTVYYVCDDSFESWDNSTWIEYAGTLDADACQIKYIVNYTSAQVSHGDLRDIQAPAWIYLTAENGDQIVAAVPREYIK